MPIIIADERAPGQLLTPSNSSIYEFNPWEVGTFDLGTFAFAPLRYIGSNFSDGVLPNNETCIRGFDNAGFIMGTSSSLFNQAYLQINSTSAPDRVKSAISNILINIGQENNDIADWPNPFYHYNEQTNPNAQSRSLTLVDGGENLENIPFHPLIQQVRSVDVVFAIDASADTDTHWPNGTAMVATYGRSLGITTKNATAFPSIPDQNTFVNLGLNIRPTFFGCDATNMSIPSPIIVYLPQAPYSYNSNVSTFDLTFNNTERNSIIQNGYNIATMGNGTVDAQWPTCVGCVILSRSLNRTGTAVPPVCSQCLERYCWNGTVNSTMPAHFEPTQIITESGGAALRKLTNLAKVVILLVGLLLI